MATLKELLLQVADNKPLDPTQRGQLANIAQDLDDARQIFRTWQRPEDKRVNTNYLDLPFAPISSAVLEQDTPSHIHSIDPHIRGAININWQSRVNIQNCRVITKGTGKPANIIGDFIRYLLTRFARKIESVIIVPR